jgi:uncharacterized membrane protein YphA (DoxX/SURF4 family)
MRTLFVLGRAIFGGYFAYSGLHHFVEQRQMSGYAASKGVPAAELAVPASGALILAGGLSVVAGVKPRDGLAAIVAFLIPVTLEMHRFWEVDDPGQRMSEMINFSKNMALVGAALMMMQLEEPWPLSLDSVRLPFSHRTKSNHQGSARLHQRDVRALPA